MSVITERYGKRTAITTIEKLGVKYEVEEGGETVWKRWVPFGRRKIDRPGGYAFLEMAKAQEREARR